MKRYLYLFSATTLVIIGIVFIPKILLGRVVPVNLSKVTPCKTENTVICSGKIEYSDINNVYIDSPSIIEKINVNTGDVVNKNDIVFKKSGAIQKSDNNVDSKIRNIPDINNFSNVYEAYDHIMKNGSMSETVKKNYVSNGRTEDFKSPYTGIVSSISVKENDVVEQGSCVFAVAAKDKMQIKALVNESQISEVKKGNHVIISGIGFKNSEYKGIVTNISNEAKQVMNPTGQETVVEVTVLINNVTSDIKPGFTAKCKIITSQEDGLMIIPYEAIRTDKHGRDYSYISSNGIATKKFIETGREFENGVEVISGIEFEDQLITNIDKLFNGERVISAENREDENNV